MNYRAHSKFVEKWLHKIDEEDVAEASKSAPTVTTPAETDAPAPVTTTPATTIKTEVPTEIPAYVPTEVLAPS